MAIIAFYVGKGDILNRAIRFITRAPESHCEVIAGLFRGTPHFMNAIGASGRDGGVKERLIRFKADHWIFVDASWAPPDFIEKMQSQIDKPYDFFGVVFSQFFNFRRQDKKSWFCSEIIAWALGLPDPHRYSPSELRKEIELINQLMEMKERQNA